MTTSLSISTESPKVFFSNGHLVTTSQAVADYFDKQHKHVLAKIDSLECSQEFTSANFSAHAENQLVGVAEREIRYFEITKDGFMFLVMGFTGKKAARLKEAYIAKFNAMETELHQRSDLPALVPDIDLMNFDIYHAVRNGKVSFVKHYKAGQLTTAEEAMSLLRSRGWLVMPREELAGRLMEL